MNCRRCRNVVTEDGVRVRHHVPPPDGRSYYLDGDTLATEAIYHRRCLPPNVFHKFAGSLPVGHSPADTSLGNEHAIGGGLFPKKRRKRPARRIRYNRTKARRQAEAAARDERQREAAKAAKIQDTLERGGKPALCHCRTFSTNSYFITPHGRCGYCGGWTPEVFRTACGDDALRDAISELAIHDRTKMLQLTGLAS